MLNGGHGHRQAYKLNARLFEIFALCDLSRQFGYRVAYGNFKLWQKSVFFRR